MNKIKYWLWLVMVFGVGNERLWQAMKFFDYPEVAYIKLCRGEHDLQLKDNEIENISRISLDECERLIQEYKLRGIETTGFSSREYPQYLRNIYNPPAVLFYKGDISLLNNMPAVAIVGTRRASNQSLMTAARISREIAESGFIIVSGFAVGTDINSQLGAANAGFPTVSVMGCGLDQDYPKDNFCFRDKILKNNGIFISEYLLGTPPRSFNFPKRNRILSGLSRAVVVVEASERSGALVTASLALEQGREVFVLPPANIYDERYSGNIKFLREGANPIYGYEDLVSYFEIFKDFSSYDIDEENDFPYDNPEEDDIENDILLTDIQSQPEKKSLETEAFSDLSDMQKSIVKVLSCGKKHIDFIAETLGCDILDLTMELSFMELKGTVKSFAGKIYGLK